MIFEELAVSAGIHPALLTIILVWSLVWKGLAMWKSARLSHPIWFIVFLLVQSVGILEILYIFLFSKFSLTEREKSKSPSAKSGSKTKLRSKKRK